MKTITTINQALGTIKARSAWSKGVLLYAYDLLENLSYMDDEDLEFIESNKKLFIRALMNGAANWYDYSEGGASLCYDQAIAARLCNKTELKRTNNGLRNPNKYESWLEVQARALFQASEMLWNITKEV